MSDAGIIFRENIFYQNLQIKKYLNSKIYRVLSIVEIFILLKIFFYDEKL